MAHAVGLTYIDAVDQSYGTGPPPTNLFQSNGSPLDDTDPFDQLNPLTNANTTNVWGWRSFGVPSGGFSTIYESVEENAPELRMTATGLAAGNYDVYAVYWSDRAGNWNIRAGTAPGTPAVPLTAFDRIAQEGATAGILASSAAWTLRPGNNTDPVSDADPSPFVDRTAADPVGSTSTRDMYLGQIGTNVTAVGGQISVWLDDLAVAGAAPTAGAGRRSWIEGIALVPTGNPVFVTATIDRNTGNLMVNNPTSENFTIASYSINSAAGSLNATEWLDQTHDRNALNDPNPWALISPVNCTVWPGCAPASNTALSEAETPAVNGLVFPATSGTIDFGNVWRRTPVQDVQVNLTLANGDVVVVAPTYTGTAVTAGDFNADGAIDTADYIALIGGLHANFATRALAYAGGDINTNGVVDRNDVTVFRNVFNTANGTGSFEAMLAGLNVPEPPTIALVVLACSGLVALGRRRRDVQVNRKLARKLSNSSSQRTQTVGWVVTAAVALASGIFASSAAAVPVSGWAVDPDIGNAAQILTNADTDSPMVGDGSTDSANQTGIWASFAPLTVANGEEIVLSGLVTLTGVSDGTANGAFRWGLFQDYFDQYKIDATLPDAVRDGPTNAWLGYIASNASGGPNGRLDAKNPDATEFLTVSHISTATTASAAGNCTDGALGCGNRVFNLATGGSNDGFDDDTYEFRIIVGRYGDEVTVSASIESTVIRNPIGDYNDNGTIDTADYVVWRDLNGQTGVALPNEAQPNNLPNNQINQADYNNWRANFGDGPGLRHEFNLGGGVDRNGFPPTGTGATRTLNHVPFTYDRVGLFFAEHLDADMGTVEDVDVATRIIQSVTLEVNTATGSSRFVNSSTQTFDMSYYEITSDAGSLLPANWTSFDDAEGGDPIGVQWDEAGGSDANVLSEINLTGTPKAFGLGASTGLENIFSTGMAQDLRFFFLQSDGSLIRGIVNYIGGAGSVALVPEPASVLMLACGALLFGGFRQCRRARTAQ